MPEDKGLSDDNFSFTPFFIGVGLEETERMAEVRIISCVKTY